jgi:hypothetical protein
MRAVIFFLCAIVLAQAPPPKETPGKKPAYQERRADLLRKMAELRAGLQALELELQLLEEEKQSAPAEATVTNQTAWRETVKPDGRKDEEVVKKARPRCSAFTSGGKRCTRSAETGSKFCWQHRH